MKNLTWQNPEQLFVAQELINKVKSKCCGIKEKIVLTQTDKDGNKVTSATLNLSSYNTEASGTQATYDAIVAAMGKIKYVNNGNNVQTFELRIPVEFTYTWGTVKTTVDCTVKSTMGN